MHPQILSWLRDTGKLTVRYILVGFAFVPVGLLYAELTRLGRASMLSMGLSLALGFVTANAVWKWSATKQPSETAPIISQALAAALAGPVEQGWVVAVNIVEAQERERMFTQVVTSGLSGRQLISTPLRLHQRQPQVSFAQRAGAAHAAFSGVAS